MGAITSFCSVTEIVAVSPTLMVAGIMLLLSTISKTCDRAVPWHGAHRFDEDALAGAKATKAATAKAAISIRYVA